MDDAYDMRAVEAQLARMEAARRAHAAASRTSAKLNGLAPHANGATVVGDFELSAVDSSASEDDSDGDASASTSSASDYDDGDGKGAGSLAARRREQKKKKTKKATLRDSLDLSMSASVALPARRDVAPVRTRAEQISKTSAHTSRAVLGHSDMIASHAVPQAVPHAPSAGEPAGEDRFAGKLVQRRRELERKAGQQQPHELAPPARRNEPPCDGLEERRFRQVSQSDVVPSVPVRGELMAPAVAVSRLAAKNLCPSTATHELEQTRGNVSSLLPNRQPDQKPFLRPSNASGGTNSSAQRDQPLEGPARRTSVAPPETSRCLPVAQTDTPAAANRGSCVPPAVPVKTTGAALVTPSQATTQPSKQLPAARQPLGAEALAPKAVLVPAPNTKKTSTIIAPPIVPSSTSTTAAPNNKPPGYARTNAMSNQAPAPSVPPTTKSASPTKREPEDHPTDDVIDDLLTAEELRLRESLDKLTSRLSSLATARTTPSPQAVKPSSHPSAAPSSADHDDNKTIRSAAYGGGTHTRLHQPTSPTSRASHAKRSELSGGVHKARVRVGGVTAQEAAAAGRTDSMADGKHKIVVKRDLAHLLF